MARSDHFAAWLVDGDDRADNPHPPRVLDQAARAVADLERVVGAGLADDALPWTVVQRGRAGTPGVHLPVLMPDNLATGRSFNPAAPGWERVLRRAAGPAQRAERGAAAR